MELRLGLRFKIEPESRLVWVRVDGTVEVRVRVRVRVRERVTVRVSVHLEVMLVERRSHTLTISGSSAFSARTWDEGQG